MTEREWFSQPFRVRLEWGRRGARSAAERGDAVVIVDVLRFSTAAVAAAMRGVELYPVCSADEIAASAAKYDAIEIDQPLASASYDAHKSGERIIVPSPNGATCVQLVRNAPLVMIGAIVNASAVARCISWLLQNWRGSISVIACGERWSAGDEDDGAIRFAIEDYLGAGAILSGCDGDLSPEAALAAGAFDSVKSRLSSFIAGCGSGIELMDKRDRRSVEIASEFDRYDVVPILRGDTLVPLRPRDAHDLAALLG